MRLKAVLFDLDFTLWRQLGPPDYEQIQALQVEAIRPLLAGSGFEQGIAELVSGFWQEWTPAFRACNEDPDLRELDSAALLHAFLNGRGCTVSGDLATALWRTLDIPLIEFELYADTLSTIEEVRRRQLRAAIITNRVNPNLAAHLIEFGIRVDVLVSSATAGHRKPHPAAIGEALRQLGVTAAEAVLVGDVYEVDVLGAQRAGVRSVLKLNDFEDRPEWSADYKIRELADLLPVLDSILADEAPQQSASV
jgi:HAD superfamily hydrolase (TIGR01549 family)